MSVRLKNDIIYSIKQAESLVSNIDDFCLNIDGMSSPKIRHFLNNLCKHVNTYLEIGSWKGSTLLSANCNNKHLISYAIDNFSEFPCGEDIHSIFINNVERIKNKMGIINFFEEDCFNFDFKKIDKKIDVYFYDGNHSEESQYKALEYFKPVLNEECIIIIDDWNHERVKKGTNKALKELKYNVLNKWIMPARKNGDIEQWWNGVGIFQVEI